MAHTITLSDEQYAKIAAMAQALRLKPEAIISELFDDLPEPRPVWTDAEYAARWHDFKRLARTFSSGGKLDALTADEYDEALAEEAMASNDDDTN